MAGDYREDILIAGGWPVTEENLRFIASWQHAEGGHTNNSARFNWLNSTQGRGVPINAVGVLAYPSYQAGIQNTVATIRNGRYPHIVEGLAAGDPYRQPGVVNDLSTWVSGRPNANIGYGERILGFRAAVGEAVSGTPLASTASGAGCSTMLVIVFLMTLLVEVARYA